MMLYPEIEKYIMQLWERTRELQRRVMGLELEVAALKSQRFSPCEDTCNTFESESILDDFDTMRMYSAEEIKQMVKGILDKAEIKHELK